MGHLAGGIRELQVGDVGGKAPYPGEEGGAQRRGGDGGDAGCFYDPHAFDFFDDGAARKAGHQHGDVVASTGLFPCQQADVVLDAACDGKGQAAACPLDGLCYPIRIGFSMSRSQLMGLLWMYSRTAFNSRSLRITRS